MSAMAWAERRREPRTPARGAVRLLFSDPTPQEVRGELMDVSSSGFRASHSCAALRLGQVVAFAHPSAKGRARVMWNRILPDGVVSGFVVL